MIICEKRPKSAREVDRRAQAYFGGLEDEALPTDVGLALALGFTGSAEMLAYCGGSELGAASVKRAVSRVEASLLETLGQRDKGKAAQAVLERLGGNKAQSAKGGELRVVLSPEVDELAI